MHIPHEKHRPFKDYVCVSSHCRNDFSTNLNQKVVVSVRCTRLCVPCDGGVQVGVAAQASQLPAPSWHGSASRAR